MLARRVLVSALSRGCVASQFRFASAKAPTLPPQPKDVLDLIGNLKTNALARLMKTKLFDGESAKAEVEAFFSLRLEDSYYKVFSSEQIAEHIYGFIMGRHKLMEKPDEHDFTYEVEHNDYAVYICANTPSAMLEVDEKIEAYLYNSKLQRTHSTAVRSYTSKVIPPGCSTYVVIYTVSFGEFQADAKLDDNAPVDINKGASLRFLKERPKHVIDRYQQILNDLHDSVRPVVHVHASEDGETLALSVAFMPDRVSYLSEITQLISSIPGASIKKKFVETFANGAQVYTIYTEGATKEQLQESALLVPLLPNTPRHPLTVMYHNGDITANQLLYAQSLITFAFYFMPQINTSEFNALSEVLENNPEQLAKLKQLRGDMWKEVISAAYITDALEDNVPLLKKLYDDFVLSTNSVTPEQNDQLKMRHDDLARQFLNRFGESTMNELFLTFLTFNRSVMKTNFFKVGKTAIGYRLDCSFFNKLDFPKAPYGVFLMVGAKFRGFHVRFSDIARGGIRIIYSGDHRSYKINAQKLFPENYGLAYTQHNKNKDIPEGGSKGTILLDRSFTGVPNTPSFVKYAQVIYMNYVDTILDLIIPETEGVRDRLKQQEILFLGPDENTAGKFPAIAALYSQQRKYSFWKSFTTGKDPSLGGIPHDTYGMTTCSVREYAKGIIEKLNLREETLTKIQTGGPDGDLGENEIRMSSDKTCAVVDGSGVAYDPNGLDREELLRLCDSKQTIRYFNPQKLTNKGFVVTVDDKNLVLPHGETVTDGSTFRNEFHFHPIVQTNFFVPCGGRPDSVNMKNVHRLLVDMQEVTGEDMLSGKVGNLSNTNHLKYKYIVEGANLFITENARMALENVGVILFKDASTNKGGVTSSSLEVLAGLALDDAQHKKLMCSKDKKLPQFYQQYVQQVVERVKRNARREFECIWNEYESHPFGPDNKRCKITNRLSGKIVELRSYIITSDLYNDTRLRNKVLEQNLPRLLLDEVGLDTIIKRVPENYLRAIFSASVASEFVYTHGLAADDFQFFKFMRSIGK